MLHRSKPAMTIEDLRIIRHAPQPSAARRR
jgi:hypothetical protein